MNLKKDTTSTTKDKKKEKKGIALLASSRWTAGG